MTNHTPLTSLDLDDIAARAAALYEYATVTDPEGQAALNNLTDTDVPALLAEIRRLKGQRKYLIGQLAKRDAETGPGDKALREFLTDPEAVPSDACAKCKTPFDPANTRFDGAARYSNTPYCGRCIDGCHESTDAFHRCVICQ